MSLGTMDTDGDAAVTFRYHDVIVAVWSVREKNANFGKKDQGQSHLITPSHVNVSLSCVLEFACMK